MHCIKWNSDKLYKSEGACSYRLHSCVAAQIQRLHTKPNTQYQAVICESRHRLLFGQWDRGWLKGWGAKTSCFPQKINRGGCVKPKCQKDYFDPGVMQSHCLRIKIQSWKWAQQVQFNSQWQRECSEVENSPAATRFTVLSHFLLFCNPSKCRLKRKLHCCFFNLLYSTYKKYVKCSGLSQVLGTHSVHYSFVPLCAISKMIRVFIRVEIVMVKSFEHSNLKPDFFCHHLHAKR